MLEVTAPNIFRLSFSPSPSPSAPSQSLCITGKEEQLQSNGRCQLPAQSAPAAHWSRVVSSSPGGGPSQPAQPSSTGLPSNGERYLERRRRGRERAPPQPSPSSPPSPHLPSSPAQKAPSSSDSQARVNNLQPAFYPDGKCRRENGIYLSEIMISHLTPKQCL